jgi:hypothetical protein
MLSLATTPHTQDSPLDYWDGYFDGSIGIKAASDNEDYRKGYYQGLENFLGW